MKTHKLKTVQPYFQDVLSGDKRFEVRYNDRNFQVGDRLLLEEYDPKTGSYSGAKLEYSICYILEDYLALKDGYVILGLR